MICLLLLHYLSSSGFLGRSLGCFWAQKAVLTANALCWAALKDKSGHPDWASGYGVPPTFSLLTHSPQGDKDFNGDDRVLPIGPGSGSAGDPRKDIVYWISITHHGQGSDSDVIAMSHLSQSEVVVDHHLLCRRPDGEVSTSVCICNGIRISTHILINMPSC